MSPKRCACGELHGEQGRSVDVGRWSGQPAWTGSILCADQRTAPLRPRMGCLRAFCLQHSEAGALIERLAVEVESTKRYWKQRQRVASAAAALMMCLWASSGFAVKEPPPRKEAQQPKRQAAQPEACDPKNPAACDGCPSRCYCPNGGRCSCIVKFAARCSSCTPRLQDCPKGLSCACSGFGCCCE